MEARETYSRFARFYDDYVGSFSSDIPLYLHLCRGAGAIAEIGCGTGRILKPLLECGLSVRGVDISEDMLDIARTKLDCYVQTGQLALLNENIAIRPLRIECTIMLVTYYTFNYLLSDRECRAFIQNAYEMLPSNGRLVMDLFYPKSFQHPETDDVWSDRTLQSGGHAVLLRQKRSVVGDRETRTQIFACDDDTKDEVVTTRRYFAPSTIHTFLQEAGFGDITMIERYDIATRRPIGDGEEIAGSFVVHAHKS